MKTVGFSRHYGNVDILRGFAALSVFIYHIIELYPWPQFLPDTLIGYWFRIGWMGVDLFFVISGFVISLSAFALLEKYPNGFRLPFARRRIARIVPLYYLTCLVFAVFCTPWLWFDKGAPYHVASHLLFLHNLHPVSHGSINGSNWSVGTEMQFYVLVMLCAPLLRRVRPLWILAGGILTAMVWRFICFRIFHDWQGVGAYAPTFLLFWSTTQLPGMLDEFACGIFLARLVYDRGDRPMEGRARWLPRLLPIAAVACLALTLYIYRSTSNPYSSWLYMTFWRSGLGLSWMLVVAAACVLNARWLSVVTTPLRYLGVISYGIYLWHLPVILAMKNVPLGGDGLRFSTHVIPLVLVLAIVSWHFLEKPCLTQAASAGKSAGR